MPCDALCSKNTAAHQHANVPRGSQQAHGSPISWAILLPILDSLQGRPSKTNKDTRRRKCAPPPLRVRSASLSLRHFEAGLKLCVRPCPFQNADPGSWLRLPKRGDNHGIDSDAARSHVVRSARASLPSTSKSKGRCPDSPYALLPLVRRGPNRPIFLGHFMCQTI